jgi:prolyl oligopeptidase
MTKPAYPHTRTADQIDDYHGTLVADPYRWLEETDSPQTSALWLKCIFGLTPEAKIG